jgi:uncharacterized membrane protein YhaH (DUF805 family)
MDRVARWLEGAVGLAVALAGVLYFLQTRSLAWLAVLLWVAVLVPAGAWTVRDARAGGRPALPWLVVVAAAPVLGLAAYLFAREDGERA